MNAQTSHLAMVLAALSGLSGLAGCATSGAPAPLAAPRAANPSTNLPAETAALLRGAGIDPAALRCNAENRWGATLRPDAKDGAADILALLAPAQQGDESLRKKVEGVLFWRMVRSVLIEGDNNNLGVIALRGRSYLGQDGVRRPLLLFRSGLTPAPDQEGSCFRSLLSAGGVRHVVNLFDGDIPVKDLTQAETRAASQARASYSLATDREAQGAAANDAQPDRGYGPWRDTLRKRYDDPAARQQASQAVARLIREQILAPAGQPPKGNIHIHCGGGMHRSGMIAGIVERCVNGAPLPVVEAHYRYHVGYRDAEHPGGQEEGNLRFLREFDCSLLAQTR